MAQQLLSFLLATLILACPLNCMSADGESADTTTTACCSHCQSQSPESPLAPDRSSDDCCQCFCSGAIFDKADSQLALPPEMLCWLDCVLIENGSSLNQSVWVSGSAFDAPPLPAGRALRCLQMSFLC